MDVMASFSPNFRKLKMARPKIKFCAGTGEKTFRIFAFATEILNWFVECFHYALGQREGTIFFQVGQDVWAGIQSPEHEPFKIDYWPRGSRVYGLR